MSEFFSEERRRKLRYPENGLFNFSPLVLTVSDFDINFTCCALTIREFLWLQHIKKNRDPRWEEEFSFMCEEPPTNDKIHVEVLSRPSSIGIHSKVITCILFQLPTTCDSINMIFSFLSFSLFFLFFLMYMSCATIPAPQQRGEKPSPSTHARTYGVRAEN